MRSIATSVFVPSKTRWEETLQSYLGQDYVNISSFSLGGTHLSVFVHLSLTPIISNISSDCVATGIQNVVGNKGGVCVRFCLGKT
jgi:hypothetical protein